MKAITTSAEYHGGPLDSRTWAVEVDTEGQPPAESRPLTESATPEVVRGGHYQRDGHTDAGRWLYRWVPEVLGAARPTPRCRCREPGPGCPRWAPT